MNNEFKWYERAIIPSDLKIVLIHINLSVKYGASKINTR